MYKLTHHHEKKNCLLIQPQQQAVRQALKFTLSAESECCIQTVYFILLCGHTTNSQQQ
jgi:hypothetical protein